LFNNYEMWIIFNLFKLANIIGSLPSLFIHHYWIVQQRFEGSPWGFESWYAIFIVSLSSSVLW